MFLRVLFVFGLLRPYDLGTGSPLCVVGGGEAGEWGRSKPPTRNPNRLTLCINLRPLSLSMLPLSLNPKP